MTEKNKKGWYVVTNLIVAKVHHYIKAESLDEAIELAKADRDDICLKDENVDVFDDSWSGWLRHSKPECKK